MNTIQEINEVKLARVVPSLRSSEPTKQYKEMVNEENV